MNGKYQLQLVHEECEVDRTMGREKQRARRCKGLMSEENTRLHVAGLWVAQAFSSEAQKTEDTSSAPTPPPAGCSGVPRRGGTCPLLLDGMDVGLSELPAIRELLPLVGPQVPGGQSPQYRAELLRFLPMVLLKGQTLPREATGVPE